MIVESSARKVIGFPYLGSCCLDQDDEKWMTRFIWYGAFRIGIHLTALILFSFFFFFPLFIFYMFLFLFLFCFVLFCFCLFVCLFVCFVLFLLIYLSDPSLSARYSADIKTGVLVVILYFVTD